MKKLESISQVMDLLDNTKAKFYGGSNQRDLNNISREDLNKMDIEEVKKKVNEGLFAVVRR